MDGAGGATADLAAELRKLWAEAERARGATIKVSAVAKRLHLSSSSVYAYLDGTTLPSLVVLDKLLHALAASPAVLQRMAGLREDAGRERRNRRRTSTARGEPAPVPWQLPPDVRGFTGRKTELARLDELLAKDDSFAATMALVSGTAGVGKTALVVHWAHRVRAHFPDGLLYVDLRGFDPEQPLDPAQVLATFLRSLGMARDQLPSDLSERTALFRDTLDRKRILVFLDNAASEEQVRPLIPNSPHGLVVVTSRNSLHGLVARHGAHHVRVPHLPLPDAVALLEVLVGNDRVAEDEDGAAELVRRCALLPLAIRLGAELASTRRRSGLAELAGELRRYHLDLFSAGGDERTAIRTVFSWSYLHLRAERARAFRLLGMHPGQDLDLHTCAALMDVDLMTARQQVDDLVRANLLEPAGADRFRMHDLLRAYAREEADRHDPVDADEAMQRLFDHYVGTCQTAMALVAPYDADSRPPIDAATTVLPLATGERALDWLDAERRNLLTLAEFAANGEWPYRAIQVSALLWRYLDTRGHYGDAMALHTLALKVARNHDWLDFEGWGLASIGTVHSRLGQLNEARENLVGALKIEQTARDPRLECQALRHLGHVYTWLGQTADAVDALERALPLARTLEDRCTGGYVLSSLGLAYGRSGRDDDAVACHHGALVLAGSLDDHDLLGHVLNNLGLHYQHADAAKAETCHRSALTLAHAEENPSLEATALLRLGTLLHGNGESGAARELLLNAAAVAEGFGNRDIEAQVAAILDAT